MELKFKSKQSDSKTSKPLSLALGGHGDVGKSQMHLGDPCPLGRSQQVGVGERPARQQGQGCDQSEPGRWVSSGVGESEAGRSGPGTDTQVGVDGLSCQCGRIPRYTKHPSALGHMHVLFLLPVMLFPQTNTWPAPSHPFCVFSGVFFSKRSFLPH